MKIFALDLVLKTKSEDAAQRNALNAILILLIHVLLISVQFHHRSSPQAENDVRRQNHPPSRLKARTRHPRQADAKANPKTPNPPAPRHRSLSKVALPMPDMKTLTSKPARHFRTHAPAHRSIGGGEAVPDADHWRHGRLIPISANICTRAIVICMDISSMIAKASHKTS